MSNLTIDQITDPWRQRADGWRAEADRLRTLWETEISCRVRAESALADALELMREAGIDQDVIARLERRATR